MVDDNKPLVVVSRCLGFENCRWNGEIVKDEFVDRLSPYVEFRTVCPEVQIGLGVPRDPIHIESSRGVRSLVQPATGRDVTAEMLAFCSSFLSSLGGVDGFLLKARSPSCGPGDVKIYAAGGKSGAMDKGSGFFGDAVLTAFPDLAVESEGRLNNFRIREHYLTRLFATARLGAMEKKGAMRGLVDFHARNKLLLMAYNQAELKTLGHIVANHEHLKVAELLSTYRSHFARALSRTPRYTSNINVLMHAMGYFSQGITSREKSHFLQTLERYRAGNIPLSAALGIVNSWIARFDQEYLRQQTFFAPYPEELAFISDSGKGRDL
ncbi:MAG: DUF523 and DUF1722 domain-containing protein [Actinomycetota bacterium]|nr:DUF523 and DUF1722 domain-containing protein [Actinomycetota bacterium]